MLIKYFKKVLTKYIGGVEYITIKQKGCICMTKKIFSLILCVVIAASVFAAVSVTAATDYKGAEITLDGNANACAITKNSPFKDLDFGESNTKNVEFTVYNNTSKRISQVYIAWEWATTLYNPDKETEKIDGATFNGGIAPGASATFTLTLPKRASIFYGTYGIHNASYSDYNVRFDFDGAPASGEKIIVTSNEQSVINNLAADKGFVGVSSAAGVNTLIHYKGAEITFNGALPFPVGITKGSPFKDLDFGSETEKKSSLRFITQRRKQLKLFISPMSGIFIRQKLILIALKLKRAAKPHLRLHFPCRQKWIITLFVHTRTLTCALTLPTACPQAVKR